MVRSSLRGSTGRGCHRAARVMFSNTLLADFYVLTPSAVKRGVHNASAFHFIEIDSNLFFQSTSSCKLVAMIIQIDTVPFGFLAPNLLAFKTNPAH